MVAILELARGSRAHSRSELIERTGLSRAVVTHRVSGLERWRDLFATLTGGTGVIKVVCDVAEA